MPQNVNSSYDAAITPGTSLGGTRELDISGLAGDYASVGGPAASTQFPKGALAGLNVIQLNQAQVNYASNQTQNMPPMKNPANNTKRKADVKIKFSGNSSGGNRRQHAPSTGAAYTHNSLSKAGAEMSIE
jgi:hypothetical protein